MSFTPGSIPKEDDRDTDHRRPTTAAFSPISISNPSSKRRSMMHVNQKSSLLLATPPQITRALAYSHPFLLPLNKIVGLITWTSGDPWESFLLISAFWGVVLYGDQVLRYAGPLFIIISIILGIQCQRYSPLSSSGWLDERQHKKQPIKIHSEKTGTKHQKTLDEIVETLRTFSSRCHILLDPLLEFLDFLSAQGTATPATQKSGLISLIIRILFITPLWIILALGSIQIITTRRIFLVTGTLFLSWHSQPSRIARSILWRSATVRRTCTLLTGLKFSPDSSCLSEPSDASKSTLPTDLKYSVDSETPLSIRSPNSKRSLEAPGIRFTFILYENQRRWIGLGWTTNLFSYERTAWTDENLNPAPAKDDFNLPQTEDKTTCWRWVEGSQWLVEGAGDTDEGGVQASFGADGGLGWIYYDNKWELGRRGNDGWGRYTRRRKWYRDAELVEITHPIENDPVPTPSTRTSTSLLSAIKSAIPYSVTAPTISPEILTHTDAINIPSSDHNHDDRDASCSNSWNSNHLGSVSFRDDPKKSTSRSSTNDKSHEYVGGSVMKPIPESVQGSVELRIGTSERNSVSVSSVRSDDLSDDGLRLKRPTNGDWSIEDVAKMGFD